MVPGCYGGDEKASVASDKAVLLDAPSLSGLFGTAVGKVVDRFGGPRMQLAAYGKYSPARFRPLLKGLCSWREEQKAS